ncbi:hypothetical protein MKQ70_27870 [Chitinophaga sedimenti]|nr:hypothetical protein [Chitinophaga sedimenti]MCK7558608.1 hypothetical protein [Chitinophaga sedimenti]
MPSWFFALYLADVHKVFEALHHGFYVAEHHGAGTGYVQFMCCTHHVEPLLRTAFALGNQAANTVVQNFGAGAWQAVHTGFL